MAEANEHGFHVLIYILRVFEWEFLDGLLGDAFPYLKGGGHEDAFG